MDSASHYIRDCAVCILKSIQPRRWFGISPFSAVIHQYNSFCFQRFFFLSSDCPKQLKMHVRKAEFIKLFFHCEAKTCLPLSFWKWSTETWGNKFKWSGYVPIFFQPLLTMLAAYSPCSREICRNNGQRMNMRVRQRKKLAIKPVRSISSHSSLVRIWLLRWSLGLGSLCSQNGQIITS